MNKIVKVILLSGIYALGYWIYFYTINPMVPLWYKVKCGDGPMVIFPITYAVFTVILLYNKKCFEKIIHILIFIFAAILFNIVIYLFICVFLYVDGFDTLYTFYSSEKAPVISALLYIILHIGASYKHKDK